MPQDRRRGEDTEMMQEGMFCPPGPYFPLSPGRRELVPALGALVDLVRIGAVAVAENPGLVWPAERAPGAGTSATLCAGREPTRRRRRREDA
jgi:hypothetical protein